MMPNQFEDSPLENTPLDNSNFGAKYYYVKGTLPNGRNFVNGPHNSMEEANQWGYSNISDGNYEVVPSKYASLNLFNQQNRVMNMEQGQSIHQVLQPTRHTFKPKKKKFGGAFGHLFGK
jgi:hypothetical protein